MEAVGPSYSNSEVLQDYVFIEPYAETNADYFHTGIDAPADRDIEELLACTDISLDDKGRTASVHLEQNTGLTPGEVKSLFGQITYAEANTLELDPVYELQAEIMQIYEIRPEIQMIQDGFGYTYEEIDSAIFYHGDLGALQKSLKGFLTAQKYYSLKPEEKSDILDLIFGGYTNSQAFAAYISSGILNKPIQQLISDKQTEIVEDREQTEEVFVEDGQEEDRKALAALMGVPYITLDTFLEGSTESVESLRTAYIQARNNFYRSTNEQKVLPANAVQDAGGGYTPEEILDEPFSYDSIGEVSINLNTGSFKYSENDLIIPGKNGLSLEINRIFDPDSAWAYLPMGEFDTDSTSTAVEVGYRCYLWENYGADEEAIYSEISDITRYTFTDSSLNSLVLSERGFIACDYELAAAYKMQLDSEETWVAAARDRYGDSCIIVIEPEIRPVEPAFSAAFFNYGLTYNYLINEFGMGHGWRLGFSTIETYSAGYEEQKQRLIMRDGTRHNIESVVGTTVDFENYTLKDIRLEKKSNGYSGAVYTLFYKDGTVEYFDAQGRNIAIVDRFGNAITLEYTYKNAASKSAVSQIKITDTLGNIVIVKEENVASVSYVDGIKDTKHRYNKRWTLSLNGDIVRNYYSYEISSGRYLVGVQDELGQYTYYSSGIGSYDYNCFIDQSATNDGIGKKASISYIDYPQRMQKKFYVGNQKCQNRHSWLCRNTRNFQLL